MRVQKKINLLWSDVNCVPGISYLLALWYLVEKNPIKYINSFGVTIALKETRKFIYSGLVPMLGYF